MNVPRIYNIIKTIRVLPFILSEGVGLQKAGTLYIKKHHVSIFSRHPEILWEGINLKWSGLFTEMQVFPGM